MAASRLFKWLYIAPLNFMSSRIWMSIPYIALTYTGKKCITLGPLNKVEEETETSSVDVFDDVDQQESSVRSQNPVGPIDIKEHDFTFIGTSFHHICMFSDEEFNGDIVDLINMKDSVSVNIGEESDNEPYMY